ncbi:hypothetical protein FGO68_gene2197 [Halteria grandinella]|uniref:Uncharacterized protein n=1 Tax=Halteria grandinella TaxID=5974 RepID=A0A8J8NCX7_HALGN|nr:hypothetical protein FGO68_gene2197 [Halteria grandinella]
MRFSTIFNPSAPEKAVSHFSLKQCSSMSSMDFTLNGLSSTTNMRLQQSYKPLCDRWIICASSKWCLDCKAASLTKLRTSDFWLFRVEFLITGCLSRWCEKSCSKWGALSISSRPHFGRTHLSAWSHLFIINLTIEIASGQYLNPRLLQLAILNSQVCALSFKTCLRLLFCTEPLLRTSKLVPVARRSFFFKYFEQKTLDLPLISMALF